MAKSTAKAMIDRKKWNCQSDPRSEMKGTKLSVSPSAAMPARTDAAAMPGFMLSLFTSAPHIMKITLPKTPPHRNTQPSK